MTRKSMLNHISDDRLGYCIGDWCRNSKKDNILCMCCRMNSIFRHALLHFDYVHLLAVMISWPALT